MGVYIHIPFCIRKCRYCDFYSVEKREWIPAYTAALCGQIQSAGEDLAGYAADTVYLGGGTPSFAGSEAMGQILNAVRRRMAVTETAEITLEANPDSGSRKFFEETRRQGFNRVSLGIQSASDRELAALGRAHTYAQAKEAYLAAQAAGYDNISVDMMYGLPGQTVNYAAETLEKLLELQPQHISAYGLKAEPGTPLFAEREKLPDDDIQADMYLDLCRKLRAAGYVHYEISNFAKPGFESRHNLKYWTLQPYLGFGPGAHSFFSGRRYSYPRDLNRFLQGGAIAVPEADETAGSDEEYIMLGLRLRRGIEKKEFEERFSKPFDKIEETLQRYEQAGYTALEAGRWRLTEPGFLVSNAILTELLTADKEETICAR